MAKKTTPDFVRSIAHCTDIKRLRKAITTAQRRISVLSKREYAARAAAAWDEAKQWDIGTTVWCCAAGTFLGGTIQRGWTATVTHIQPRAKRLWTQAADGATRWFTPAGLVRYAIKTTPPDKPLSKANAKVAQAMGEALRG